jgi:hypothetical protein
MNKTLFLKYLEKQEVTSEQQFFSGICNEKNIQETLRFIQYRFEEKFSKPRRLVRKKGYRDKGSLGTVSRAALRDGVAEDYYLTVLQYELERKEELNQMKASLLSDYLQEGRVLTDELLVEFKLKKGVKVNEQNRKSEIQDYVKRRENSTSSEKEGEYREGTEELRVESF